MSSILTELGGFTPVVDLVTQDVGLMTSVVYGLVWRHCQMKDGVCKKTIPELASMLEVSNQTIRRHLGKLCEAGYIKDKTPDLRNRPHVYIDTGKVKITGTIEAITTARPTKLVGQTSALPKSKGHTTKMVGPHYQNGRATLPESHVSKTGKRIEETGETPAPPDSINSLEDLTRKAVELYCEIAKLKLDNIQATAIADLVGAEPEFNFTRWAAACTSTKLAGVLAPNVQCRIDTYKAGGNYQAMRDRKHTAPAGPPPSPAPIDAAKRAAYLALQAESAAATAESVERVNGIMAGQIKAAGVDVERATRRASSQIRSDR